MTELIILGSIFTLIVLISLWETRKAEYPAYKDILFTALRLEELLQIVKEETDKRAVQEAKKELERRKIKY